MNTHMQVPIVFSLSGDEVSADWPRVIAPDGASVSTPDGFHVVAPKP